MKVLPDFGNIVTDRLSEIMLSGCKDTVGFRLVGYKSIVRCMG